MSVADKWADKLNAHAVDQRIERISGLYNEWATDYDKVLTEWQYQAPLKCAKLFKQYLDMNSKKGLLKILDIGCGTGLVAKYIYDMLNEQDCDMIQITGIDISDKSLEIAGKKRLYHKLIQLDISKLPYVPFETDQFDFIICCGVLAYFKDPIVLTQMFKEWVRITKPNSIIILTQWNANMSQDKALYYDQDGIINWKCIQHIENQLYIPNNKYYADKKLVDYFIATNIKSLQSKL